MKIHFIGIGGIGVSALAQYYLEKGHKVSGSDLSLSEITDLLKEKGAKLLIGKHRTENLPKNTDLVVYSPAVLDTNPELKEAKKLGVKILEFPLVKIEDTRELGKFTALKLTEPTAIIINSIENATAAAQNAFLKNLEEPQENLFYILTAANLAAILPTIVSRCQIIKAKSVQRIANSENAKEFLEKTIGEKLLFLDKIKDRGEAKDFVQEVVFYLHDELMKSDDKEKITKNLEILTRTLNNLKANGNVNLQLANMTINLV